jgi:hypothetical protein
MPGDVSYLVLLDYTGSVCVGLYKLPYSMGKMVQIRGDGDMDIVHQYQKPGSRRNNHAEYLEVPEASSYMWEEVVQVFASRLGYTLR